jgi:hypothetical protein
MAKRKIKRSKDNLARLVLALKADPALRARWVTEPKKVLEEFGVSAAEVLAMGAKGLVVQ